MTWTRNDVFKQVQRLYDKGTISGLGEDQLWERFVARRDEVAFEALVARHGPMVLGVCRRILRDPGDIEDAFQATFVVLIRKCRSISDPARLGPWLHGVAVKTASRARQSLLRRRLREKEFAEHAVYDPAPSFVERELRSILDEELDRLPKKYRLPIVLCYLEGRTHDEAAARLGWPVGTVRGRLFRAREQLRGRLMRRGIAPAVATGCAGVFESLAMAMPTDALVARTVDCLLGVSGGGVVTAGAVSAGVAHLSSGVLRAMFLTQMKFVGVAAIATGVVATSAVVRGYQDGRATATSESVAIPRPAVAPAATTADAVPRQAASVQPARVAPPANPRVVEGTAPAATARYVPGATASTVTTATPRLGADALLQQLERTRQEIDGAIAELNRDFRVLQEQLHEKARRIVRLQEVRKVLQVAEGTPVPSRDVAPPAVPRTSLRPVAADEFVQPADVPAEPAAPELPAPALRIEPPSDPLNPPGSVQPVIPNSIPAAPAPPATDRIDRLEHKLDALLNALESLKGEVKQIKAERAKDASTVPES